MIIIRQRAGGSYGYTLGVIAQGAHVAPRNRSRPNFALMADVSTTLEQDGPITNHGGRGGNFLYEDGHFQFVPISARNASWLDHPFQNRHGRVEAGVDEEDAVIAPSFAPPFIRDVSMRSQY